MARLELEVFPPPPDPGNEIEDLAWFRFPVTWNYVGGSPFTSERVLRIKPVAVSPAAITLVSPPASLSLLQTNAIDIVTSGEGSKLRSARSQWEMVIPKMVRPSTVPVADRIPVAPAAAPAASVFVENEASGAPPEYFAPALALPEQSRFARSWRLIALLAIIFLSIGFTLLVHSDPATQRRNQREDVSINRGGWSRRSILPQGRMMSVYEPSREESDYRIEFGWIPDAKGVGWVFRTRDAGDYYATHISVLQPGARPVLIVVEHFSVFGGAEGAHSRRVIPLGSSPGLVRVRMDAIGPAFSLSLQGSAADYWTDARIESGALGFYDERGQRPEVQSLRFTFVKKGTAQTAAATLP
jgi:hypothetical protein